MGYVKGLKCRECAREYPVDPIYVCEFCFGPLEVLYDIESIKKVMTRELIESRKQNLWRYKELLPIDRDPTSGLHSGFTPLVRADKLAKHLGMKELYIKDDTVTHPTLSFKDRVVAIHFQRPGSSALILLPVHRRETLLTLYLLMVLPEDLRGLFLFLPVLKRARLSRLLHMSQIL